MPLESVHKQLLWTHWKTEHVFRSDSSGFLYKPVKQQMQQSHLLPLNKAKKIIISVFECFFCIPFSAIFSHIMARSSRMALIAFSCHWDSLSKLTEVKCPATFSPPLFMFHCSSDFGRGTMHSSVIPPEAAGVVTVHQCKVPLTAISDFHSSFSYSCIQS